MELENQKIHGIFNFYIRNSEQYPKRPQPETEQAQRGSNGFNVGGFQFNFFAGVIPGLLGVQFVNICSLVGNS